MQSPTIVKSAFQWASTVGAVAVLTAGIQSVSAQSVGVHFVKAGGSYRNGSSADALAPTDSAGAPGYAQANWNNLGQYGDSAGWYGTAVVLTNSTGAATLLSIMWDSQFADNTGQADSTPDQKLMDGYISAGSGTAGPLGNNVYNSSYTNKPLAYVGNLNAWCRAQGAVGYNVVLYVTGHAYWETVQGYFESASGNPFSSTMVEGSLLAPPLYALINGSFSGTYNAITSTNSGSPNSGYGGYMVFGGSSATGLTNDAVLIRLQNCGYNAGISGFQIIPVFAPLPAVGGHFVKAGGSYRNNSSADALAPTDSAGAPGYAQTNWNNLGQYGDSAGWYGTAVVLTNSTGAATSLSIMWDSQFADNTGQADSTPDQKLMDGYISAGSGTAGPLGNNVYNSSYTNKPLAYVGNLNAWCQAQGAVGYNVVLYVTGHAYWETVQGYFESASGNPFSSTMVEGSLLAPPLYALINGSFSGTYNAITSTNSGSPNSGYGGYMVFGGSSATGLTNDAVLIRLQNCGYNAGISGFQIIPIPGPKASIVLALSSSGQTNGYLAACTFTATVNTNSATAGNATGTVQFLTNGVAFDNEALSGGSATSVSISTLPRGTNVITAQYAGDINYLGGTNTLNQMVTNHPPVAAPMTVTRTAGLRLLIAWSDVATNWSDADGDTVTTTGINLVSTNGVNLMTNSSWILYTNSPNVNDQISYGITDGFGGMNIGYINVVPTGSVTGTNSIVGITTGSTNVVKAYGIPGFNYILDRSTNLTAWVDISTNTAATNGVINAVDTFWDLGGVPPTSAYYRLKWQP